MELGGLWEEVVGTHVWAWVAAGETHAEKVGNLRAPPTLGGPNQTTWFLAVVATKWFLEASK